MTNSIIDQIEPISNKEIFILTIGVYIGIVVNHMDLWLVW